jgi:lysophospholipase L1-like esterase
VLHPAPLRPLARVLLPTIIVAAASAGGCGRTPIEPLVRRLGVSRILTFGDSLTEGDATPSGLTPLFKHPTDSPGPAKSYPYKLLSLLTTRYPSQAISVYNGGLGGRSVFSDAHDLPDRTLGEFLDAFNPEVMILLHGANDLNLVEHSVPQIAGFTAQLIDKAKARGTQVILSSLPPRIAGGTPPRASNPQLVLPYNDALAAIAAQKAVPFVDIYPHIFQSLAGPDIAPDGLHLTQAGNDKLAALYFSALVLRYEIVK